MKAPMRQRPTGTGSENKPEIWSKQHGVLGLAFQCFVNNDRKAFRPICNTVQKDIGGDAGWEMPERKEGCSGVVAFRGGGH